jgi:cytochrome c oxidase cbb3-type subunit 4
MNYGLMHSLATVFAFLAFTGICWWAWRPANRQRFEDLGRLPLDNDPVHAPHAQTQENGK